MFCATLDVYESPSTGETVGLEAVGVPRDLVRLNNALI